MSRLGAGLSVMILSDSNGNPRGFPPSEVFYLPDTYPYIIRSRFKDSLFWQLTYGDITTSQLLSQPVAYLSHCSPDIIIVQSGFNDCKPEAFTDSEKFILGLLKNSLSVRIKKYYEHPGLIRRRQIFRVTKESFRATAKKLKLVFSKSRIIWVGIGVGEKYEKVCPGIDRRTFEFNQILHEIYGVDFIPVQDELRRVDGFNNYDHVHWNKCGHRRISEILISHLERDVPGVEP